MADENVASKSREKRFVENLFRRKNDDTSVKAKLRRSASPSQQHMSWDILAGWGIDIERDIERIPFQTVAALIGSEDRKSNGTSSFGKALRGVADSSEQAEVRLRRVLSCDTLEEASTIIAKTVPLIRSHSPVTLDYAALLEDLVRFGGNPERVKIRWASHFYHKPQNDKGDRTSVRGEA